MPNNPTPSATRPPDQAEVLARTLFGEARGEDRQGREMVAATVMNRVNIDLGNDGRPDWWGEGFEDVCLKPYQFSCWNARDPNRPKLLAVTTADPIFRECLEIARMAVAGELPDATGGATHYLDVALTKKLYGRLPNWMAGRRPTAVHGHHTFFRIL